MGQKEGSKCACLWWVTDAEGHLPLFPVGKRNLFSLGRPCGQLGPNRQK